MKTPRLFALALSFLAMAAPLFSAPRDAEWKAITEAMEKDQPQTTIQQLTALEAAATADAAWAELAKAIALRTGLQGRIEGGPEHALKLLDPEIAKAPEPARPLLKTIQAHWFHSYYSQNQWRFAQRSTTAQPPSDDIETWDLARILAEVDRRFQDALADPAALQAQPVADFAAILTDSALGDTTRPTLYDFIAYQALEFYSSEEMAASRPQDAFRVAVGDPAFGSLDEFLAWKPQTTDSEAPAHRALTLLQDLLRFHQPDADPTALYTADLARLRWAATAATGPDKEKSARNEAALRAFITKTAASPVSADARLDLAQLLSQQEKFTAAHTIASEGAKAFPDHLFGQRLASFAAGLAAPALDLVLESTWTPAASEIRVDHRNLDHLHFRAYRQNWDPATVKPGDLNTPENKNAVAALLKGQPAHTWDAALPDDHDFRPRTTTLPAPTDFAPGDYFIIASARPDFSTEDNQISLARVRVTALALTLRQHEYNSTAPITGIVTHALTGKPVADAQITIVTRHNENSKKITRQTLKTDAQGHFTLKSKGPLGRQYVIARQGENFAVVDTWANYNRSRNKKDSTRNAIVLFTDRAIYRPGQTIHFKGIWCRTNVDKADYHTVPDATTDVVLEDSNDREIAKLRLTTNERGSFAGTFTAPASAVLGVFTIQTEHGSASIRVEEYKRPKFATEILPPSAQVALGQKVTVTAKATAYTGAAVDAAKVAWRVTRQPQWPSWIRWWYPGPLDSGIQEIAHGEGLTAADGTFAIPFDALPDPDIDPATEPVFHFTVTADVTDAAGETRSATWSLPLGITSLAASIEAPAWITPGQPFDLTIRTRSHGGQPLPAQGTLRIHRLQQPEACQRPNPIDRGYGRGQNQTPDMTNPDNWPLGEIVSEIPLETAADGEKKGSVATPLTLAPGYYRAVFTTADASAREIKALQGLRVLDPAAETFPAPVPFVVTTPKSTLEPGETFTLIWGSGYPEAHALVEWFRAGKLLHREWSTPGRGQQSFTREITEQDRGGLAVRITQVSQNVLAQEVTHIFVPWSDRDLKIRWEHFTDKLQPGAKDTWTAVITGPDGQAATAEMVATLYDASLDAFAPHYFSGISQFFRREPWLGSFPSFSSTTVSLQRYSHWQGRTPHSEPSLPLYRQFDPQLSLFPSYRMRGGFGAGGRMMARQAADPFAAGERREKMPLDSAPPAPQAAVADQAVSNAPFDDGNFPKTPATPAGPDDDPSPDLDQVSARENLNETAFFFPQLTSDENGEVRITFTMPEALTKWRFLGFAHDSDMRSGALDGETVTSKDLMAQPNPPRFLREGDEIEFPVRITNLSDKEQSGTARLTFADAATLGDASARLGLTAPEQAFTVPARESRTLTWKITVPDGPGVLQYKAVAATDSLSDGEQAFLPVIPRRILVTESMSLPIRNAGEKHFTFEKLRDAAGSDTLETQFLEVQAVSQPAWYAVLSLPYLMEFPHECSEQIFHRYYANALARHIAQSDPKIRRVFDLWKGTEALDSPLLKNQDIKNILIEETPWLRDGRDQTAAHQRIGLLFEDNHMDAALQKAMEQLGKMQHDDGLFPWFTGGTGNEYITLNIATGFARLRALGVATDITTALRALPALDASMNKLYQSIKAAGGLKDHNLSPYIAHYLYTRTFFLKDVQIKPAHREAFDYFAGQAEKHWTELGNRMSRAHAALALQRLGKTDAAKLITRSLRENALNSEELGMRWNDKPGWFWYQSPIETQAMMIEAFRDIDHDAQAVEDCQVWLIKHRQTNDWRTTTATADAVYALLMGGRNQLASDALLQLTLGERKIQPENVEPGTGYYASRLPAAQVTPDLAEITVTKTDPGVSWASVHWQYLEDMAKITPHTATPLTLEKQLYLKKNTEKGPQLVPLGQGDTVKIGDELVTRLVLRNDRPMEFLHLKDYRGSGTEPVNVLSGYRWQDGFGYYEVTRDTASHFFIDHLPAGTHVFETSVRIQQAGHYQTGIAEIQSMYAPEFNSHSASLPITAER